MDNYEDNFWLKAGKSKKQFGQWLRQNIYPIIIALASLLVLVFFPMIGSGAVIGTLIPTGTAAILFWTLKGLTVALNLAIFSAFRAQAKQDISDHPNYIEARRLLAKHKPKGYKPLSPAQFGAKQWGIKGTTLALSTGVTTIALTNIILNYDWVTAVSCLITIIMAIIFGLLNMATEETYWTDDFLQYARMVDAEREKASQTSSQEHEKIEESKNTNQEQNEPQIDCFQANKEN